MLSPGLTELSDKYSPGTPPSFHAEPWNQTVGSVARDRSLHILVDPVTHGCRETEWVKTPWAGWANSMERGDKGLLKWMK